MFGKANKQGMKHLQLGNMPGVRVLFMLVLLLLFNHVESGFAGEPLVPFSKVSTPGGYDHLAYKAQSDGSVRVIVKVNGPAQPMGELSPSEAASQVNMIAHAQDKVLELLSGYRINSSHKYKYIPYIAMTLDKSALDALIAIPEIEKVEEDMLVPYNFEWNMTKIGAPNVWSTGYDGSGYTVAILDTGVDKDHPFLAGAVVSEACYSTIDAAEKASSLCPGGVTSSTATGSAMPYTGNCPAEKCDHGTHVAGIAAGRNNGSMSGVANNASVIAIQVFSRFDDSATCDGPPACALTYSSDQTKGLERVFELKDTYNIAAVNMSLGGGRYYSNCDSEWSSEKAAIDNLRSVGIATVISSGNESYTDSISGPACISTAVSVGSTDSSDNVSGFSNSIGFLSLLAPGSSINSSVPGGGYDTWDGTSMAAPHVAGAWAVLKQLTPSATVGDILSTLISTGVTITDARNGISKPRIQIDKADLTYTKSGTGSGTVSDGTDRWTESATKTYTTGTTITLTATADHGFTFVGYSGDCSGTSSTCTLTMSAAKNVTATFSNPVIINPGNNHSYQRIDKQVVWSAAKGDCRQLGGYLATVTSADENTFLVNNLLPANFFNDTYDHTGNRGNCWIGASDTETAGVWKWVTGEDWQFTAWATSQPDNKENDEHCLAFSGSFGYTSNAWDDIYCAHHSYTMLGYNPLCFICEWDPVVQQYTLTVSKSGTGSGTVTASPGTLSWRRDTGTASYNTGTSVTLTAAADDVSTFAGYSGDCFGSSPTCTVTMSAARNVTAMFNEQSCSFTIAPQGKGFASSGGNDSVSVSTNPDCSWTAVSNATWITISAGSSGSGSGTVSYSVSANTGTARTGTMTIAQQSFTVTQDAASSGKGHPKYDFDGDGNSDVLWKNAITGDVYIWLMNGKSIIGGDYVVRGVGTDWDIKVAGDFNGDGKADILWQNKDKGDVYVYLMTGTKISTQGYVLQGVPKAWEFKNSGDFDGDGNTDILWQNTETGDVAVWLMAGITIKIGDFIVKGMRPEWMLRAVADLNGDKKADILWQNSDTGDVVVWLMDGATISKMDYASRGIPGNWQIKAVVDFDGDGKADILWQDITSGDVAMWLMDGVTIKIGDFAGRAIPLSWQIIAAADYNGDGKVDILWKNTTSGDVYIWLMDGTKRVGEGFAAHGVPGQWETR